MDEWKKIQGVLLFKKMKHNKNAFKKNLKKKKKKVFNISSYFTKVDFLKTMGKKNQIIPHHLWF